MGGIFSQGGPSSWYLITSIKTDEPIIEYWLSHRPVYKGLTLTSPWIWCHVVVQIFERLRHEFDTYHIQFTVLIVEIWRIRLTSTLWYDDSWISSICPLSQLVLYTMACVQYSDFLDRTQMLIQKLLRQGYVSPIS